MGRDFNENDYEMLSQLDIHNNGGTNERTQMAISQLPTYAFKSVKEVSP
jgi:hypothetical protein